MAYSAVALLAFFAAFHNADGVLGGDSMTTASSSERTLVDEPMMMAPEPEFDLATSRARVNQDPATLSRAELRYGNYLPLLGRGRRLLDSEEAAAAPAPAEDEEGTLELATERGFRLGGQAGMDFLTGMPYPQTDPLTGRLIPPFDNRRHLLEAEAEAEAEAEPAAAVVDGEMASMMMMAAPEPEMDLATSRARVNQDPATLSRAELRSETKFSSSIGNYLPLLGQSGRKLLDSEEEAEDMEEMMAPASYDARRRQLLSEDAAPAPEDEAELVMSTERGRLGGRTGVNLRTGTLYTQNRFDDRRRRQLLGEEMESEMMMMAPEPEMDLATTRARLAFSPGRSFDAKDSPALLAALGNVGRRRLLGEEMESEMMMMAPEPEVDLATERGRIGGRTGFNQETIKDIVISP